MVINNVSAIEITICVRYLTVYYAEWMRCSNTFSYITVSALPVSFSLMTFDFWKPLLSCPHWRCEYNWRQDKTVLSCLDPVFNFQVFSNPQCIWDCKLETWSRQDKTVLSCLQCCSHRRHGQDKTVLSCPCRRCEQAVSHRAHISRSLGQGQGHMSNSVSVCGICGWCAFKWQGVLLLIVDKRWQCEQAI